MHDDLAVRRRAGAVALGADRGARRLPQVADARIGRHQVGDRVRAVVEDDQLLVRVVLREEQTDRLRHEVPPVGGGHDAGDEGHADPAARTQPCNWRDPVCSLLARRSANSFLPTPCSECRTHERNEPDTASPPQAT